MAGRKRTETETLTVSKPSQVKRFNNEDLISCVSVTSGGLYLVGDRSNNLYEWMDYGDEIEVEYRDLVSLVRSRSGYLFNPQFLIKDQDFIEQNKTLSRFYDSLYDEKELLDIMKLSAKDIEKILVELPDNAKDTLKGLVSTAIHRGELDSVQKIKVFDQAFGTDMLSRLTL